mgnify:CR=1 FL=1
MNILLIIPLIGCLMAASQNNRLLLFREQLIGSMMHDSESYNPVWSARIVDWILAACIVLFVFTWPLIPIYKALKRLYKTLKKE